RRAGCRLPAQPCRGRRKVDRASLPAARLRALDPIPEIVLGDVGATPEADLARTAALVLQPVVLRHRHSSHLPHLFNRVDRLPNNRCKSVHLGSLCVFTHIRMVANWRGDFQWGATRGQPIVSRTKVLAQRAPAGFPWIEQACQISSVWLSEISADFE